MVNLMPTLEFRFVERQGDEISPGVFRTKLVLQQYWDTNLAYRINGKPVPGEWRDVPTVKGV